MRAIPLIAALLCTAQTAAQDPGAPAPAGAQPTPVDGGPSAAPAPGRPAPTRAAIEAALARYAHEPSVDAVVRAALQTFQRRDPEAVAARARAAGWVPRLSLRARRGQAVDLADGGDSVRLSTDDDLTLEAGLVFELDRLVFRREETAIFRAADARSDARMQRVREVVALYFERRRLQLERDLVGRRPLEAAMRIAELTAVLDIFTNGAFLAMMKPARWRTAGSTPATRPKSRPKSSSKATR